jgi:pilus assembly protein CpaE
MRPRRTWQDGQASVELIALLPAAFVVGLAILAVLAARSAAGDAAAAAQAGAMALIQDADPRAAARAALPRSVRSHATIRVGDRRVTVTVRPLARPAFAAGALAATASAAAGPEPAP